MYRDHKSTPVLLILAGMAVVLLLCLDPFSKAEEETGKEASVSMKEAILRSALQCYVVEGVYPPDLQYLQDNYGLTVNTKDYYIDYTIFAENLPPEVRVIRRKKAEK